MFPQMIQHGKESALGQVMFGLYGHQGVPFPGRCLGQHVSLVSNGQHTLLLLFTENSYWPASMLARQACPGIIITTCK